MLDWLALNAVLATLLALVVLALTRWARPGPTLSHALWLLVVLRLLVPPVPAGPWSLHLPGLVPSRIASTLPAAQGEAIVPEAAAQPAAVQPAETNAERESDAQAVAARVDERALPAALPTAARAQARGLRLEPRPLLFALWFAGALAAGTLQLRRWLQIRRLLEHACPADAALAQELAACAERMGLSPPRTCVAPVSSPFVLGLVRAHLVWPVAAPSGPVARRGILTHELAHLRRQDQRVAWLELAASILFWWLPGLGFVRARLRQAADEACDAWVVRLWPEDRRTYAQALVEAVAARGARPASPVALGVLSGAGRAFEQRLLRILEGSGARLTLHGRLGLGLLLGSLLPGWRPVEPAQPAAQVEGELAASLSEVRGTFAAAAPACLSSPGSGVRFALVRGADVLLEERLGSATLAGPHAIGTVSGTYTATLAVHLDELGSIDLDDSLGALLELASDSPWAAVRLSHVLEHTAGLPAELPEELTGLGWAEVLARLQPASAPGIEARPSRAGLALLGHGLERRTGLSLQELMARHLVVPAGGRATGWRPADAGLDLRAADGLVSTFEDLVRFLCLQMGAAGADGRLPLSGATLRAVQEPRRILTSWLRPRGLGWEQRWSASTESYYERGSRIGEASTVLAFSPQHKLGVVLVGRQALGLERLAVELLASAIPTLSDTSVARAALGAGRLDEAEVEFARLARTYPEDGLGPYGLGMVAMHRPEQAAAALVHLERAWRAGHLRANSAYNLACAHARLGQVDEAFEWLREARRQGFQDEIYLESDPDLASLRADGRFAELARPAY